MSFSSNKLTIALPGTDGEEIEVLADELIIEGACFGDSTVHGSCIDKFTRLLGFHGFGFLPEFVSENLPVLRAELESRLKQVEEAERALEAGGA